MNTTIDLADKYIPIIKNILQKHLPLQSTVWIFGSRATGKAKKFSDIDLLIDAGEPLSPALHADLAHDFDESSLPYKVDIVGWSEIDPSFRDRILVDRILFWKS